MILYPHIFADITEYHQLKPVKFGSKRIFLHTEVSGHHIMSCLINGVDSDHTSVSVSLKYDELSYDNNIMIQLSAGDC